MIPTKAQFMEKHSKTNNDNAERLLGAFYGPLFGGKLNLRTKEVIEVLGSPRLFQRLRHHQWLVPLYPSQDKIYPAQRVVEVQLKMMNGDLPPLLPSEMRTKGDLS